MKTFQITVVDSSQKKEQDIDEQSNFLKQREVDLLLTPTQIGERVALLLGTGSVSEGRIYREFRLGDRAISKSRIPPLAKVLKVSEKELLAFRFLKVKRGGSAQNFVTLQIEAGRNVSSMVKLLSRQPKATFEDIFLALLKTELQE